MPLSQEEKQGLLNQLNQSRQRRRELGSVLGLPQEEPGVLDKLAYGFDKGVGSFEGLVRLGGQISKSGDVMKEEGITELGMQHPGPGGTGVPEDVREKQLQAMEEERKEQVLQHEVELAIDNPMLHGNPTYRDDLWIGVGEMGKMIITDVTLAVPFGSTVKGAAALGGTAAIIDDYIRQQAVEGEVDPVQVGLMGLAGAGGAALLRAGGDAVSRYLKTKADTGQPVTADEIAELSETYGIRQANSESVADTINRNIIKPEGHGPKSTRKSFKAAIKEDPEVMDHFEHIARNQTAIREAEQQLAKQKHIMSSEAYYKARDDLVRKQKEQLFANREASRLVRNFEPVESSIMSARNSISRELNKKYTLQAAPEVPHRESMTVWDSMGNAEKSKFLENLDKDVPVTEEPWKKSLRDQWNNVESDEVDRLWSKRDHEISTLEQLRDPGNKAQAIENATVRALSKQAGSVSRSLVEPLTGASVGGAGGYAVGGEEGALLGAAMGAGLPWTGRQANKAYKSMLSVAENTGNAYTDLMGWAVSSPTVVMNRYGPWGQLIARDIRTAFENVNMRISRMTTDIERRLKDISTVQRDEVSRVLQKLSKPSTPEMKELTDLVKKDFNKIVDESVDVGFISKKVGELMKKKADLEGFWPRIYNDDYLSTREGKEAFADALSSQHWSEESIESTLSSILGENRQLISEWMEVFSKQKSGGSYIIRRDQALKLLADRGKSRAMNRSSHLESKRKLHVKSEEVLRPFMHTDPHRVLTEYFYDAYRRIEFAKKFDGFNVKGKYETDLNFNRMASKMSADMMQDPKNTIDAQRAVKFARQLYYTSVGDSRSGIIAQQANMRESVKRIYGVINAFQTLKLSMAQIINSGQSLVIGSTLVSSLSSDIPFVGTARGLSVAMKGIARSFTKEGREFAKLSGATVESTMLEIMGETGINHTLLGRPTWKLTEWLNNPTEFLRATGFLFVEKLQRTFAANMGHAFIETVLNDKAKILKRIAAGKTVTPRMRKKLKMINEGLERFGVDSRIEDVTQVPQDQMLRAGQRFSNQVNFVNKPDTIPMLAQYPHASIVRKFKTFVFHHTKILKDSVIKPATKGNINPLITYLGVMAPVVGVPMSYLRDFIKGDDKDYTMTERYLRGLTAIGGMGIIYDYLQAASYGPGGVALAAGGPTVTDIGFVLHGGTKVWEELNQGDLAGAGKRAGQTAARLTPPPISSWLRNELKDDAKLKAMGRSVGRGFSRGSGRGEGR